MSSTVARDLGLAWPAAGDEDIRPRRRDGIPAEARRPALCSWAVTQRRAAPVVPSGIPTPPCGKDLRPHAHGPWPQAPGRPPPAQWNTRSPPRSSNPARARLTAGRPAAERPAHPCSATAATPADVDLWWQLFLRRFDLEHTFRLMKQTLGWTAPKVRHADSADLWTWLIIAAHAQLRLARPLAEDLRHPWERPAEPRRLTPARVRRGFRNLRATAACPAAAPQPSRPGPGRPPGSKNRQRAKRHDVGKTVKRAESIKEHQTRRG